MTSNNTDVVLDMDITVDQLDDLMARVLLVALEDPEVEQDARAAMAQFRRRQLIRPTRSARQLVAQCN